MSEQSEDKKPDVKPATEEGNTHINLKVVGPDDETAVHFKIKRSTQMKKLMKAFCEQRSLPQGSIRFYFDGVRIGEGSTPTDLEMEEDDTIEVYRETVGGH